MPMLDMATLQFASMAGRFAFILLFALFCFRDPAPRAFRCWTASIAASCLAMMLIYGSATVHQLPPLYGGTAYAFVGASVALYQAGGEIFFGRKVNWLRVAAFALAPGLIYVAGRLALPSIFATMLPVVLVLSLLCARAALVFLTRRDGRRLAAQYLVAGALGAYSAVLMATAAMIVRRLAAEGFDEGVWYPEFVMVLVVDQAANMIINVGIVTMALERVQNHLREAATTDPLTGLANRRGLLERSGPMIGLMRRRGAPLAVLVADLDHFKEVNDRNGHDAGDAVLAEFAVRMRMVLRRRQDLLGRWGGEEFVALLPDIDETAAARLGEHLREAVGTEPFETARGPVTLTVSIGLAALERGDLRLEEVVARADRALYAAKRGGRNRLVTTAAEEASGGGAVPGAIAAMPQAD